MATAELARQPRSQHGNDIGILLLRLLIENDNAATMRRGDNGGTSS
jgi:hypothetical protein